MKCAECGSSRHQEVILPEHTENVGGITVVLKNTVHVRRCEECGEEMSMVPDMRGLVRAVALCRALTPIKLGTEDIKLFRRALNVSQREFADLMEIAPETVSRWEAEGGTGVGGYSEKLVRHNVCAMLKELDPMVEYDPAAITRMRLRRLPEGENLPPMEVERVLVRVEGGREMVWDTPCLMAA